MKRMIGLGVIAMLAAMPALGSEGESYKSGFYVGAGLGIAKHDVSKGSADAQIVVGIGGWGSFTVERDSIETDEESTGWRGLLGYRINRYVAAELEYLDFGTGEARETYVFELPFSDEPETLDRLTMADVNGPGVSLRGIVPVGQRVELFVRGGMLFADMKVRAENSFQSFDFADRVLYGGLGADWNINPKWSARLEYQRSKDLDKNLVLDESHVELLSLNILYRL
jgi:hypothetical protein